MEKQIISKEFIRFQKLAGVITEGQAKKMMEVLNESSPLITFNQLKQSVIDNGLSSYDDASKLANAGNLIELEKGLNELGYIDDNVHDVIFKSIFNLITFEQLKQAVINNGLSSYDDASELTNAENLGKLEKGLNRLGYDDYYDVVSIIYKSILEK